MVAVLLTLATLSVRATRWWGCAFPPDDQTAAVAAYQRDPAFSVTPPHGRLLTEQASTRACDYRPASREREESAGPQFATVWRRYTADRSLSADELATLIGPEARGAGWRLVNHQGDAGGGLLRYCRMINGRAAWLEISSTADGTPDHAATVTVLIEGRPDEAGC
ncbi:hypothetical protein [Micromonospora sp. NPDC049203]|uniref:hypothetical protein n=1 Tax=Micromonospora sp. NPDC049203 TaxID=3364267 RepID=UPI003722F80B